MCWCFFFFCFSNAKWKYLCCGFDCVVVVFDFFCWGFFLWKFEMCWCFFFFVSHMRNGNIYFVGLIGLMLFLISFVGFVFVWFVCGVKWLRYLLVRIVVDSICVFVLFVCLMIWKFWLWLWNSRLLIWNSKKFFVDSFLNLFGYQFELFRKRWYVQGRRQLPSKVRSTFDSTFESQHQFLFFFHLFFCIMRLRSKAITDTW